MSDRELETLLGRVYFSRSFGMPDDIRWDLTKAHEYATKGDMVSAHRNVSRARAAIKALAKHSARETYRRPLSFVTALERDIETYLSENAIRPATEAAASLPLPSDEAASGDGAASEKTGAPANAILLVVLCCRSKKEELGKVGDLIEGYERHAEMMGERRARLCAYVYAVKEVCTPAVKKWLVRRLFGPLVRRWYDSLRSRDEEDSDENDG